MLRLDASRRSALLLAAILASGVTVGCASWPVRNSPARYARGIVYVLPGIEGPSRWNRNIARGLDEGGVTSAIEIFDWTVGLPAGFVFNLTDLERNKVQAEQLAVRVLDHRDRFPGSPVHLVGHSGGGGVAILTLEALPVGRQIDMAILLAPAISPDYALTTALRRTRYGIVNYYSDHDISFLKVGTSIFGSIDRTYGVSAGAVGFRSPEWLGEDDRALYSGRLRQVEWNPRMARVGASGTHLGWASREFARKHLAPLIRRNEAAHPMPMATLESALAPPAAPEDPYATPPDAADEPAQDE